MHHIWSVVASTRFLVGSPWSIPTKMAGEALIFVCVNWKKGDHNSCSVRYNRECRSCRLGHKLVPTRLCHVRQSCFRVLRQTLSFRGLVFTPCERWFRTSMSVASCSVLWPTSRTTSVHSNMLGRGPEVDYVYVLILVRTGVQIIRVIAQKRPVEFAPSDTTFTCGVQRLVLFHSFVKVGPSVFL